ncbi:MAG: tRNA (adenosine(37)-N6)-threonylcarbamoyltransferase complex ATPase subunit type 1 TsaE [Dehalococcoidia bacterium]|nr:tRNA (adenosine(37)-N6)-threonylcarbamoyltransferase complex ATPase subunit type 1 TsaE [Dehalococcoidia bacterium]MDP7240322.1 tRNA (adenosine(37)-N6)-threonylcarbamoyltransferase complex ATPase subunit type 1 TsaE [Dehalococcoidia bacterium]MDP7470691.1 tRNA (adenosine(37)-N6)-threonylcarbamoyltransferase complex ATPase subunit type 1 TsaE [Dehalococcoidia bacterium]
MAPVEVISHSVEDTQRLGRLLGEQAWGGEAILLVGELGAGKTCLAQGVAQGLGITEPVLSPSFVLLRQYSGRLPMYHVDLYRMERISEVVDLGLDDYIYGDGLSLVEWAERGTGLFPSEHLLIELELLSETERILRFRPRGIRYREAVDKLQISAGQA